MTDPTPYGVPVTPAPPAPVSADVPADEPVAPAPVQPPSAPDEPAAPDQAPDPAAAFQASAPLATEPPVAPPVDPASPAAPEPVTPSPAAPDPAPAPPADPVTPAAVPDPAAPPPSPAPPAFDPPEPVEPVEPAAEQTSTLDAGLAAAAATTTEVAPHQSVPVADEPAAAAEPADARTARRRGIVTGAAAAGIPLLLLSGFLLTQRGDDAAERLADRREDALNEARQLALNLVSIDYRTLDRDLQRISESTTGKAREEFDEKILENDSYKSLVKDNEAVITSKIQRAGLEPCGTDDAECKRGDHAVVLVFLDQESKNKLRTTPRVDRNRVALTLVRRGDSWLVSEVKVL